MPSRTRETPTLFSELLGVNTAVDPGALPPSLLQFATNWVPTTRFTLGRRPGTVAIPSLDIAATARVLTRFRHGLDWYLYGVFSFTASGVGDQLAVSVNEAPWQPVSGGTFAMRDGTYGITQYGDFLYVGNGTDPIKQVTIGGSAIDLAPLQTFTNTQDDPIVLDDPGSHLLTGTYSYAWAIYNDVTQRWVAVQANPRTFTIASTGDQAVQIGLPLPGIDFTPSANESYHLFIAPINLPIEFAYDQFPGGVDLFFTVVRAISVEDDPIPVVNNVTRHGSILVPHRGRIYIAGDTTTADASRRVRATSLILPGLEQAIFDRGAFFPALADLTLPTGPITGMGVVSLSGGRSDPTAPLAIFTTTQTWLFFGDILGDPSSQLIQRSDRIGCTSQSTVTGTPQGLVFLGLDSVYLVRPTGDLLDVGWPIADNIRRIPPARRAQALAVFHDGFYKLYFTPRGSITNTESWWLDLRQGIGTIPSWWGPHRMGHLDASPQVLTAGVNEANSSERVFGISRNGIATEHGIGSQDLGSPYAASLRTGLVDLNRPFDRKLATRARVLARPGSSTTLAVSVQLDGNALVPFGTVSLVATGAQWNVDAWNVGQWGASFFQEGDARAEADRPRALSFALQIDHTGAQTIELRDAELALLPIPRPVAE